MKVKRDRKPSLADRLFLPSVLSGMVVTFKALFRKKDTIQYPEQQRKFGDNYRGVPALAGLEVGARVCLRVERVNPRAGRLFLRL